MADAFSRIPRDAQMVPPDSQPSHMEFLAISYPYLSWMDDLRRHSEQDSWILAKIQEVQNITDSSALKSFEILG